MRPSQPLAGQRCRQQHDEQGPEIVDQIGLGRRRQLQGGKIKGVVTEQAGHAQQPNARRPVHESGPADATEQGAHDADDGTDRERHGNHLERRNGAGRYRERRQRTPQGNG